jgi:bifunctional non-homologous end joining protein LigD
MLRADALFRDGAKTHSAKGNEWLLIKGKDHWASNKDVLKQDRSVLSGKRIEALWNPKKRSSPSTMLENEDERVERIF